MRDEIGDDLHTNEGERSIDAGHAQVPQNVHGQTEPAALDNDLDHTTVGRCLGHGDETSEEPHGAFHHAHLAALCEACQVLPLFLSFFASLLL
jgi:hypothetical protein